MRASKADFIRQMGFTTEGCQGGLYSALMFQPRVVATVVIAGVLLQSSWLFLPLATALWWSAHVPSHNPFDAFFNRLIAGPMRLTAVPEAPPPRRFSEAMAATMAVAIAVSLAAGATRTAWLFEGVFVAGSMSVVVRRVCLPALMYQRLWSGTAATPCPSSAARA